MQSAFLLLLLIISLNCEDDPIQYQLKTEVNPEGVGSISPASGLFNKGTEVEISASRMNNEYIFKNWSGDASGDENPMTVVMTDDMVVIANFEKRNYPLTIEIQGEGTVKEEIVPAKSSTDYPSGTTIRLTATPGPEWEFVRWESVWWFEEANPMDFTILEPTVIKAIFQKVNYALSVDIVGEGTVKQEVIAAKSTTDYPSGSTVRLTAVPREEWQFTGWSGDYEGKENPIELEITKAMALTATFEQIDLPIPISFWNSGRGSVEAEWVGDPHAENPMLRLTAHPEEGWYFVAWWGIPDDDLFADLVTTENPVEFDLNQALDITNSEILLVSAMFRENTPDKTFIPDDQFEQALINLGYDDVLDDYVSTQVASRIEELDVSSRNIHDLTGIEDFISLQLLHCDQNNIDKINLSENRLLYILSAKDNQLTELDLSSQGLMLVLDIRNNPLTCVQVNEQQLDQVENPGLSVWFRDEGVEFSLNCD